MALDEAILQKYTNFLEEGKILAPTLRFYGWEPACLSLGYAQNVVREVNFEACQDLKIDWLRRPTGGRAILHDQGELTYSLVARENDPSLNGGVLESFRKISGALLEGLKNLGMPALVAGKDARGTQGSGSPACFDAPSAFEVTFGGRKLIGSAQARRGKALLQQGTILLSVDVPKLFKVLKIPLNRDKQEVINQVSNRLVSIKEALDREVNYSEAETAFTAGFSDFFKVKLEEDFPTPFELVLTEKLREEKYSNPAWNLERQRPAPVFSR